MVPAANRLRRGADFRVVSRSGSRVGGRQIVLIAAWPQPGDDGQRGARRPAQVGFSVGRSVGNAVVRNAVRRKLRHLMRERLVRMLPGTRIVVRALPAAGGASSELLGRDLDRGFAKLRMSAGAAT